MTSNDPRITAYALGEIDDAAVVAKIEEAIQSDPELRETIDEIRILSGLLEESFASEGSPVSTPEEIGQLADEVLSHPPHIRSGRTIYFWGAGSAVAACLALVFSLYVLKEDKPEGIVQLFPVDVSAGFSDLQEPIDEKEEEALESPALLEGTAGAVQITGTNSIDLNAPAANIQSRGKVKVQTELKANIRGVDPSLNNVTVNSPSPLSVYKGAQSSDVSTVLGNQGGARLEQDKGQLGATTYADYSMEIAEVNLAMSIPSPAPPFLPEPPRMPEPIPVLPTIDREDYDTLVENSFINPRNNPRSTFSIDVDTAAYANLRRFIEDDMLPPRDAIRIEEMVNYFDYSYDTPKDAEEPVSLQMELAPAPWNPEHRLARIGLKAFEVDWDKRPSSNLVFLIDVSGSMRPANKLSLVKKGLRVLLNRLDGRDRVAIVAYASNARVVLQSTTANNRETILHAVDTLQAGGSTYGSAGIHTAYEIARKYFVEEGNNRIILCTDGDFNVGTTNRNELVKMVQREAGSGVFLSVFGFGMRNLKDAMLEEVSNKGNGTYAYIDSTRETRKVFLEQVAGTLLTVAKDVKIQVEFNPENVAAYRLIGYENRSLQDRDFNDDKKDAGDIGAGHAVTALYELVPSGIEFDIGDIDPLKYQKPAEPKGTRVHSNELMTVKLRFKPPSEDRSRLIEQVLNESKQSLRDASEDFRFAASVAAFGMILRDSPHRGKSDFALVRELAENAVGSNQGGYRTEFLHLVDLAEMLWDRKESQRTIN